MFRSIVKKDTFIEYSAILLIGFGLLTLLYLDNRQIKHWEHEKDTELNAVLDSCKIKIENTFTNRFNAIESLASLFILHPNTNSDQFNLYAKNILKFHPPIKALQFADSETVVTFVYPVKGNEITVKKPMRLITDPKRGPYTKRAIKNKTAVIQGPFNLRQGNKGFVLRHPIFQGDRFIGLSIGIFDLQTLISEALQGVDLGILAFSLKSPRNKIFWKSGETLNQSPERPIKISDETWTLSANWTKKPVYPQIPRIFFWLLGTGFILMSASMVRFYQKHEKVLKEKVRQRTEALFTANVSIEKSERNFRNFFDTNPSATFVWKSENGDFVLENINNAAMRITENHASDFIGLNAGTIYKDLPSMIEKLERCFSDQSTSEFVSHYKNRYNGKYDWIKFRMTFSEPDKVILYADVITKQKNAEEELLMQRSFLEKAQEIGRIGTWDLDINKNILLWTDQNYKIFELPIGSNLTYETFLDCVHPDDRQYVDKEWKASFTGKPYDIEHRLLVNGQIKWVREKAELQFDKKGNCIRGIGFTQDITERKRAEIALSSSKKQFERIFNSHLDAIFILNAGVPALITELNDAAVRIFGYSPGELIGKGTSQLHIDSSHLKKFQDYLYQAIEESGALRNFHFSMRRKDGSTFPSEHTVLELKNESEKRIGWISIVRDLSEVENAKTALHESEKKFKALYDNAPMSYQSLDKDGNFIEVNATWLEILGYEKNEVVGKNFSDFIHPDWRDHFKTNFPRFKTVGEVLGVEFELVKKDGSTILVAFHGKVGKNTDGSFKQTHCVFTDITDQKQIEIEKEKMAQRMTQIQKMESIGNLAGGIAHDFNNILFPIIGMSEMLLEDLSSESQEYENAEEILKAGKRGSDLVKQILSFSRRHEHKLLPVKIQKIVKEVLKLSRSTIPTSIKIKDNISQDCAKVMADPTQIHQVVMNLITNAYHAIEKTQGMIEVELQEKTIDKKSSKNADLFPGKYVQLTVRDNGCGMPKAITDKIFEPYFTTKERGKGTGLGLAVVHGIIKDHKGEIFVKSKIKKGSSFTVYLPVMKKELSNSTQKKSHKELKRGNEKILLVDDEISIVKLQSQMLKRLGYSVKEYTDSRKALAAFKADPENYDLIITDMTMPELTGDEFTKTVLTIKPDIPVIICTGFSDKLDKEQAESIGVKGFLMKPVKQSDMADLIREILESDHNSPESRSIDSNTI